LDNQRAFFVHGNRFNRIPLTGAKVGVCTEHGAEKVKSVLFGVGG
jgi:hypothetical protein